MEFTKKFAQKFAVKPSMPFETVMIFIDGAYLRKRCKDFWGHDNIRWSRLSWSFIRMFNTYGDNPFNANLIRIYYYDAIVPKTDPDYENQKKYFENIERGYAYTVRLGTLVKSSKKGKDRQKGVDILMAIDALTKAYQNHYETGMFLLGDADFKPLIEAVKDVGKKTIGIYHKPTCSEHLARSFDMRIYLDRKAFKGFLEDKP
jgi:uncharacterized LabA/DUF88 family protein